MARKQRADTELRAAAKHVGYEIQMLIFAANKLVGGWRESCDCYMAQESFLLHFRNLRAFLCPSLQGTRDDDVYASD